jgi:iron(III) transport system permease protein
MSVASSSNVTTRDIAQGAVIGRPPAVSWINRLGIKPSLFYYLLAALLVVLVLYPFGILVVSSFYTGQPGKLGEFTLNGYRVWLQAGDLLPILFNSVVFSAARLFIGLCFALLFAWAVARTNVPYAGAMAWLIPVPFFVPDLLTGISWLMMGNPQNGLINQWARDLFGFEGNVINLYGWGGLIFHSSLNTISFMFLMLVGFFKAMDSSYEEAAVTLGANRYKTLFTITFPMLTPAILSVSILVFVHGLESFENPLLFGNPGGVYVFANEIYRMLSYRHPPQYGAATALSVLVIITMVALLAMKWRMLGDRQFTVVTGKGYRPAQIRLPRTMRWGIFALFVIYFLLAVVIPITQIIISSFFQIFGVYDLDHFTLQNWQNLFRNRRAMTGLQNTIVYSAVAGFGVVLIGGLVGYVRVRTRHWLGRILEVLAWAPWTLPGVVMGLALLWAWALPPPPFNLYGTATVIILGFMIKGLPLGTATMQASIRQISGELEESSRVHGGSWPQTVRHILGPLLRRGAVATFVIVFAMAARDLTIPLLLYRGGTETLTVALLHYYEEGVMGTLAAIAVLQLGMVIALLVVERLIRGKEE